MQKLIKTVIGFFVFCFALYIFVLLRYKDTTFILVYHRINVYKGGLKSLYVSPETFEKQMKLLYNRGYRSITLDELKQFIEKKLRTKKVFCITFDDGYEDLLNAYSVLKKYGFKGTVYVHVNAVKNGYYTYPGMKITSKMISLQQLKSIMDVFDVGCHTVNHPDLSKISQKEIIYELIESKKFLEKNLSIQVNHFCYPFGKMFDNYKTILKQTGYDTATTLNNRLIFTNRKDIDFYSLPRIEWKEISSMSIKDFLKNFDFYIKIFFGV